MEKQPKLRRETVRIIIFLGLTLAVLFLLAWSTRPNQQHYNPATAQYSQITPDDVAVPPFVNAVNPTDNEKGNGQKEEWVAKRSDLSAQWYSAQMAHFSIFISVIGLCLILYTLWETRKAAALITEQNKIALKASQAEFQPYLAFSELVEFRGIKTLEVEGDIVGATGKITDSSLRIEPRFYVINKGKTPALNLFLSFSGRAINRKIITKGKNRSIVNDVFNFEGRRAAPSYLGIGDSKPITLGKSIIYDKVASDRAFKAANRGEYVSSLRDTSFLNANFTFQMIISFSDGFSPHRRAFILSYNGKIDASGVALSNNRELKVSDTEYIQHNNDFEKAKITDNLFKHQKAPDA